MVDHYMFEESPAPWMMTNPAAGHRRLFEFGTQSVLSPLESVPYSTLESSNSYQSLLSLRSSAIRPKYCASLRPFSATPASSLASASQATPPSTVSTLATVACRGVIDPLLATVPLPIFTLAARRKHCAEFFQAQYLSVETWHAACDRAEWRPPSDLPYYEVEWLRVTRALQPAELVAPIPGGGGVYDSESSAAAAAAAGDTSLMSNTEYTDAVDPSALYEASPDLQARYMREVGALSRELDAWDSSALSALPSASSASSALSTVALSPPTATSACSSLDAWDCETQTEEEVDLPLPSKSLLRSVYDLLAAVFCARRKTPEEKVVVAKKIEVKLDRKQ